MSQHPHQYNSSPYQGYQGNVCPPPPSSCYPNVNRMVYPPPPHPYQTPLNGNGWHHTYSGSLYNHESKGWNPPSFHHNPEYGRDPHSPQEPHHYKKFTSTQGVVVNEREFVRSSKFIDLNHPRHSDVHVKMEGEREERGGGGRWGRTPQTRPRHNSISCSTSSSSSQGEMAILGSLTAGDLREYAALVQDLWTNQRFAQEFKKYNIKAYIAIKDMLEKIKEEESRKKKKKW